ncbi:MAG: SGNH/GDSL hydrolase family protein [Blastocatellales bacterium]
MPGRSDSKNIKVLFIGNSFTARNDVPGLIAQIAESRGGQLDHRLISAGGASLRMHWNRGEAQEEIRKGNYDYVVLQEQSTLPVKNPKRMHENIRLFDEMIGESRSMTALYITWARQNAPETQDAITHAYSSIGVELGATIIPVGIAWKNFLQAHHLPVLYDKDQSHPSPAGSYLSACVFFAVLFDETPVGAPSGLKGLSEAETRLIQMTAWETVKNYQPAR